jgi:hypothetical protein
MAVQSDCLHVATSSSARYGRVVCLPFDNGLSINPGTDVMGTKPEV